MNNAGLTGCLHVEECKFFEDLYLSPCTIFKFKWIKDLIINPDLLDLMEQKVGNNLELVGTGDSFLERTPMALTLQ